MKQNSRPDTFVILDQASGYLQLDILEAAQAIYPKRVIIAGTVVERSAKLGQSIKWEKIIPYDRSSTWRRLYTWSLGALQMLWIVAWKYRKAHILSITNPPLSVFVPWLLGCQYDVLVYDVYPDALVHYRYAKAKNPIVKLWRSLNKSALGKAQKIYTLSETMKSLVAQYAAPERIAIVPIWTDNTFIQPIPKAENQFLADKPFKDKFIIAYSGNMGRTHPVEVLVDLSRRLDPQLFHVVLIGGGHKYAQIQKLLEQEPSDNVTLLPWQPVEMLPHLLSAADIGVVTLDKEASSLSVPSKTFNILSVGNPILAIASQDSELKRLLEQYNCGATFEADRLDDILSFVKALRADPVKYDRLAKNSLLASKDFTNENAQDLVA